MATIHLTVQHVPSHYFAVCLTGYGVLIFQAIRRSIMRSSSDGFHMCESCHLSAGGTIKMIKQLDTSRQLHRVLQLPRPRTESLVIDLVTTRKRSLHKHAIVVERCYASIRAIVERMLSISERRGSTELHFVLSVGCLCYLVRVLLVTSGYINFMRSPCRSILRQTRSCDLSAQPRSFSMTSMVSR